ncbi:hypothetical protein [Rhodococcus sp. 11-3]|uniref:DUF6197 family protein n=1 Tax=Rhodococcus sp. 11-3 TaxID=2854796 RepID=UPI00204092C3|nr:hypothetical protein [Rhodococcus sp. 11-3]USC16973.1 hypothetical protein KZJ41_08960 [Rhodococcus sp. 11-3]
MHTLDTLIADSFDQAATLISRDGWAQSTGYGPHGERCAFQALVDALPRPIERHQLHHALCHLTEFTDGAVVAWNDREDMTADTVVDTFRAAAAKLRAA